MGLADPGGRWRRGRGGAGRGSRRSLLALARTALHRPADGDRGATRAHGHRALHLRAGLIYERGRPPRPHAPDGLRYVDSWIDAAPPMDRCFQLMETDDPSLFEVWLDRWRDLGTFEVVPVITSAVAAERVGERWSGDAGAGPR
jgi:hypothetical protein